jgi:hypothetical protein
VFRVAKDLAGFFEEETAGFCQANGASIPVNELDPDFPLEVLNLMGERRLRDVQAISRPAEVQLFGDGDEIPKVA